MYQRIEKCKGGSHSFVSSKELLTRRAEMENVQAGACTEGNAAQAPRNARQEEAEDEAAVKES